MLKPNHHKKLSFNKLNRNLILILIIVTLAYFSLQIGVTSVVGTKGEALDQIRQEKEQLRRENEILSAKIDKFKAYSAAQDYAIKSDLKNKKVNFLQQPDINSVALIP